MSQMTTGVQRVAREVTRAIDQQLQAGGYGGRVRLICDEDAVFGDLELDCIEVETARGLRGHAWEQLTLPVAQGSATLLCLGNTAPLASLLGKRRTAVLIHDLSYRLFPGAYSRPYRLAHHALLPMLLRFADPIITVSESERAILSRLAPAAVPRLVVAQNGGWRDDVTTPGDTPLAQRRYLLYVGSLSPRKNLARVLEAAIRLAREDGLETYVVGSANHIHRAPRSDIPTDVAARIHLLGQVEDVARLAELYAGARCLLFPSLYEASPLPPIEAMRFGCPVVVSDLPAMRERCGDAVAYCDPFSIEDIIATVRRVVRDDAFSETLVRRGHARGAGFSWHAQGRKILAAANAGTD